MFGDFFGERPIEELENLFLGLDLKKEIICEALADIDISDFIIGVDNNTFISAIFETTSMK